MKAEDFWFSYSFPIFSAFQQFLSWKQYRKEVKIATSNKSCKRVNDTFF